jgi:DNA replication protein DnaC
MPNKQSRPGESTNEDDLRTRLQGHIRDLGLIGLDDGRLDQQLSWAVREKPSYTALLERVLGQVAGLRRERRVERRIKQSGLTIRKTLEAFEWNFQPKLDRTVIEELGALGFIERGDDLLLTGKTGTGKSHILQAIALRACSAGHHVHYSRCVDLIDHLYAGLADDSYPRRLRRLRRVGLLVIDDVGLGQLKKRDDEPTAAHMLFNLIDLRHQDTSTSTAITSNIKLSGWGKYLGDATIAAAILDRLAASALRIDINGPSYRQHLARERQRVHEQRKSTGKPRAKTSAQAQASS